jgi:hypothetical protein
MDPSTITAAIQRKAQADAHHGGGAQPSHEEKDEGEEDYFEELYEIGATNSSLVSAASLAMDATTAAGSSSAASSRRSNRAMSTAQADARCLERCNLFSPAALRHSALAGLGVVHAHCQQRSVSDLSYRAAFHAAGCLEAVLLGAYYAFAEDAGRQNGEKEAVACGELKYGPRSSAGGHDTTADDASALPRPDGEKTSAGGAAGPLSLVLPRAFAEQARQHLRLGPLLARAEREGSPTRATRALPSGVDSAPRALARQTGVLAAAVLSQVASADVHRLDTARSRAVRKRLADRRRAAEAAAPPAAASGGATNRRPARLAAAHRDEPTAALPTGFASPLSALDRWKGCAAADPLPTDADRATVAALRRARSLVQSVRLASV